MTVWFWDPSFHTEDNWGTHMQLLQKIQTLTDAPEGKACIKSQCCVKVYIIIWIEKAISGQSESPRLSSKSSSEERWMEGVYD